MLGCALESREAVFAALSFSAASGSLLIINKLCIHAIPAPSFIATIQFAVCTLFCLFLRTSGLAAVDGFEREKVRPYLAYTGMFVCTIYCNMKALQNSNVETLIVFRACCPIVVSLLDYLFLGRELPSARSFASLLLLVAGATSYVLTDAQWKLSGLRAYGWVGAYFCILSVEMAYGKHIVGPHLGFTSPWGPTLYSNSLSLLPMAAIGLAASEAETVRTSQLSTGSVALLALSCVVGVAISFTGWYCRSLVTATCYTVLGVANKMVTVLANLLIWDKHASPVGLASLAVCIFAAASYQQAPPREAAGYARLPTTVARSPSPSEAKGPSRVRRAFPGEVK